MVALMTDSGPVKPVSGEWQTAHACPFGVDRLVSKNKSLPSISCGVRSVSPKAAAGPTHIRVTMSEIKINFAVEFFCFIEMPSFLARFISLHATRTELFQVIILVPPRLISLDVPYFFSERNKIIASKKQRQCA
jgi:hypothetical protein